MSEPFTTGNADRDLVIRTAVADAIAAGETDLTAATVTKYVPEAISAHLTFDALDDLEVAGFAPPSAAAVSDEPVPVESAPVPRRAPTREAVEAARAAAVAADGRLHEAKVQVNVRHRAVLDATARLNKAVATFEAGASLTPLEAARQFAQTALAERAATAAAGADPVREHGPSRLDATAAYSKPSSAEGGGNFHRAVLQGGDGQRIVPGVMRHRYMRGK